MFTLSLYFITLAVVLLFLGIMLQKTLMRKLLFVNSLTNLIVVLIIFLGTLPGRESYIDIAMIYVLLNFIAMKAFFVTLVSRS